MNKVVTINLGGNAYQLEEGAYDALRRYLDEATAKLSGNPDEAEIVGDLEAAIAQKCAAYLTASKTVITAEDMQQVLAQMGPVDAGAEPTHSYKKLYRIQEGEIIFGVCNGLAAYFNIDVTLVRVLFVLATILTGGAFALAYFVAMLIIPEAHSPQERAEAFGSVSYNAQQLVAQARAGYEKFKNSDDWKNWKRQMKHEARQWKHDLKRRHSEHVYQNYNYNRYNYRYSPAGEALQSLMGLVWFVFIIFCSWWLYHHVGIFHEFFNWLGALLEQIAYKIAGVFHH